MKKKGMTLIELIAVMAMIAIIGLGIMSLFLSQNKLFKSVNDGTIIQDEARLGLTSMEDDLRVAKNTVFPATVIATTSFTINSKVYSIPTLNGIQGKVLCGFTKKDKDASGVVTENEFAYILYGKTLVRTKGVTIPGPPVTYEMVTGATISQNVNSIVMTEVTTPDVKYKVEMKLQKGAEEDTFSSVVVKR